LKSILYHEPSASGVKAVNARLQEKPLQGKKFLLVEDNIVNQKVATKILEKIGCSVDVADNGRIAVERYQANQYDMILMDCQMPEMDGYEATHEIRQIEADSGKHQPIIAMTAGAMEGDREKCLQAGMDAYISKPVRPNELLDVVRPWIHLDSGPEQQPYNSVNTFDASRLIEACADDKDFILEIATEFCRTAKEQLKQMSEAIKLHDNDKLMRTAHTLKGSSRTIGGIALAAICEELEICARNQVEAGLEGIIERANTAYLHLSFALQRLTSSKVA
jgi:CheY-like chemotaxis protein